MVAKTRYDVHSPFLYAFIEEVLRNKGNYYAYDAIEPQRKKLLKDEREIHIKDLGAGSKAIKGDSRKVKDIAKHVLMPPRQARLIFRIAQKFKPATTLELGTSLGITTLYLAAANTKGKVITVEGSESIYNIAKEQFDQLHQNNIQAVLASFDEFLPGFLSDNPCPDLIVVDGNHKKEPTLRYFNLLASKVNKNTILIFDDIHWSEEMEQAWQHIIGDKRVTLSIDLFFTGIVFFRDELQKEHYILK